MLKHFKIIILLCLISSLARFVLDSYLPSLPAMSQYFGISDAHIQLTLTLYLLGFSFSQLVYGPLSDYYGRRIIILVGLSIFFVGNLACVLASSSSLLLFARFIAGIGAGSCGVLNRAIASDCFKGAEFSKAWSYTTTSLVITLCIAPVLGGYIQEMWGWRANFILATLVVGGVLAILLSFLPETNLEKITMRAAKTPLSLTKTLKNYKIILFTPSFITSTLCYALAFSGLIIYFQVSPLLFINGFGLTPIQYGSCSLIIAGNYLIGGLIVNQFATRFGTQWLLVSGAFILIASGALMLLLYTLNNISMTTILLSAALYVIGARIVIPNAIAGAMEKLRHLNGSTSALVGFIQMLVSACISFSIAWFDHASILPLAIFLTFIGGITLCLSFLNIIEKKKSPILHSITAMKKCKEYLTEAEKITGELNSDLPDDGKDWWNKTKS